MRCKDRLLEPAGEGPAPAEVLSAAQLSQRSRRQRSGRSLGIAVARPRTGGTEAAPSR